jgi:hypothetical protein
MRLADGDTAGLGVVPSVAGNATQHLTLDDTPLWPFGHVRGLRVHGDTRELVISFGQTGYIALYRFVVPQDEVTVLAIRRQRETGLVPRACRAGCRAVIARLRSVRSQRSLAFVGFGFTGRRRPPLVVRPRRAPWSNPVERLVAIVRCPRRSQIDREPVVRHVVQRHGLSKGARTRA